MSPFNAQTTGEEVAETCKSRIANKTVLITGASPGGLGAEFASVIAKHGPKCIILATRNLEKAKETAQDISSVNPSVRVHSVKLDLTSLEQVRTAAKDVLALGEEIDVLVNNAAVMADPYSKTASGIESQFATNHIGHFLFTNLLLPKILAKGSPARVVNVSSNGHRFSPFRFDDYNFGDGETYNRWIAYGQAKTANMLFSRGLAQKLGHRGVVSVSLHPGVIQTNLARNLAMEDFGELGPLDKAQGHAFYWNQPFSFKTLPQGVATHVYAAFHPDLDAPEHNGGYLSNSKVLDPRRVLCWARDPIDAERLWKLSEELVSQKFEF